MDVKFIAPILAGILMLAGCGGGGGRSDGQGGGGVSAALAFPQAGGGSAKAPTPSQGVILGGLLGSEAGKSLDRADQAFINQQTNRALESAPTAQVSNWQNPVSGSLSSVTPMRTYQDADGTYCRDYTQTLAIGTKQESARGTACRKPDGTWQSID